MYFMYIYILMSHCLETLKLPWLPKSLDSLFPHTKNYKINTQTGRGSSYISYVWLLNILNQSYNQEIIKNMQVNNQEMQINIRMKFHCTLQIDKVDSIKYWQAWWSKGNSYKPLWKTVWQYLVHPYGINGILVSLYS